MKAHVFNARDTLNAIAVKYGVTIDAIWDHQKNRALKDKRVDAKHLVPGDILFVPDPPARARPTVTAQSSNTYELAVPTTVHLRIKLQYAGEAISGAAFKALGAPKAFENGADFFEGTTDGDGVAEFDVLATVYELWIDVPSKKLMLPIHVGTIPTEQRAEWAWSRLLNLGYIRHHKKGADRKTLLGRALEHFQRDESLTVTGELNEPTFTRLQDTHGV